MRPPLAETLAAQQLVNLPHERVRTVPAESEALVSCVVSPGFDHDDFELAEEG